MEAIIAKGTQLGDMELLPQSDKEEFIRLTDAIYEWESAYHPLPGKVSSRITDETKRLRDCFGIPADFILDNI